MAQETNHGNDAMAYLMRLFFENKEKPIKHKIIMLPNRSITEVLRDAEIFIQDDHSNLVEEIKNYTYDESTNQG